MIREKTPKTGHPVSEQTWFHQILEIEKKSSSHTEREDRCEFGTLEKPSSQEMR